jgi:hypothetical protein
MHAWVLDLPHLQGKTHCCQHLRNRHAGMVTCNNMAEYCGNVLVPEVTLDITKACTVNSGRFRSTRIDTDLLTQDSRDCTVSRNVQMLKLLNFLS